jgi:hypothetical protein
MENPMRLLIALSSLTLCLSQLHAAQILLDDVMPKDVQKRTGVASLSYKQKYYLEDWINETFVLKTEQATPEAPPQTEIQAPLSLSINIGNGQQLQLSDNSVWEIAPQDQAVSAGWLIPFPVKLTPNDDPNYPTTITDLNTGVSVKARKAT